jgi:hypothetical protein
MSHRALLIAFLLAGTVTLGCGPAARLDTPPGFAKLDKQKEYVYRSTSAEGVVIAIRGEKNDPKGNLEFWADVIDRQLRNNRYKLDGKPADVHARSGQLGRQTRYTREDGGRTYRFWATVFVTDEKVWVVEVGGDQERFTRKLEEAVARAIESASFN